MGTDFADGKGNITAFLSYRHADAVPGSDRDFSGCQLTATKDANKNVIGTHCGGSSNSNWLNRSPDPLANTVYSVLGHSFVPNGSVLTSPPAAFNSQPYIFMTREDDRYNAAFLAHEKSPNTSNRMPNLFHGRQVQRGYRPAALFKGQQPARSADQQLQRQLQ